MMSKVTLEYIKMAIWLSSPKIKVTADHLPGLHIWDHSGVLMATINIGTHRYTFLDVFLCVKLIYDVKNEFRVHQDDYLGELI